jgi:hypothetical protein
LTFSEALFQGDADNAAEAAAETGAMLMRAGEGSAASDE